MDVLTRLLALSDQLQTRVNDLQTENSMLRRRVASVEKVKQNEEPSDACGPGIPDTHLRRLAARLAEPERGQCPATDRDLPDDMVLCHLGISIVTMTFCCDDEF